MIFRRIQHQCKNGRQWERTNEQINIESIQSKLASKQDSSVHTNLPPPSYSWVMMMMGRKTGQEHNGSIRHHQCGCHKDKYQIQTRTQRAGEIRKTFALEVGSNAFAILSGAHHIAFIRKCE
jgi:ribosomal protein S4E